MCVSQEPKAAREKRTDFPKHIDRCLLLASQMFRLVVVVAVAAAAAGVVSLGPLAAIVGAEGGGGGSSRSSSSTSGSDLVVVVAGADVNVNFYVGVARAVVVLVRQKSICAPSYGIESFLSAPFA